MPRMLESPRVLISGSRLWPWDAAVDRALDRLLDRYRERLTVIEGRARGADLAAHRWCVRHRLGPDRHRCYPVDWPAERRSTCGLEGPRICASRRCWSACPCGW